MKLWNTVILCVIWMGLSEGLIMDDDVPYMPYTVTLQTLKNASAMICTSALSQPLARMVRMNDELMMAMFQDHGGSYVKEYMAANETDAMENFPNMVLLTSPITIPGTNKTMSLMDNMVAKEIIMEDLRKLSVYLMRVLSGQGRNNTTPRNNNPTTPGTTSMVGANGNVSVVSGVYQILTGATAAVKYPTPTPKHMTSSDTTSAVLTKEIITPMPSTVLTPKSYITPDTYPSPPIVQQRQPTTAYKVPNIITPLPPKTTTQSVSTTSDSISKTRTSDLPIVTPTTMLVPPTKSSDTSPTPNPMTSERLTSPMSSDGQEISTMSWLRSIASSTATTTLDPEVANGIEQLLNYANGALFNDSKIHIRDLSRVWREAETTLHPGVLLGVAAGGNRKKRNADGSQTQEHYCQLRGSETNDGFLHLCSSCGATTHLSDDTFPRYINEAVCKSDDMDCFTIAGTPHGQCKQTKFSLNMMRKKKGMCQMLVHGGESLVFEDWELVPTSIRVGCECTINKNSMFGRYVGNGGSVVYPVG